MIYPKKGRRFKLNVNPLDTIDMVKFKIQQYMATNFDGEGIPPTGNDWVNRGND